MSNDSRVLSREEFCSKLKFVEWYPHMAEGNAAVRLILASDIAQRNRIAELEQALQLLHDRVDDTNAQGFANLSLEKVLCILCWATEYDSRKGVVHRLHCSLVVAREILAQKETP